MNLPILTNPKGYILWEGASLLDGKPVVLIATMNSDNLKTGNMVQTWIIRSDVSPISAIYSGEDVSICGDCKHRGDNGKGRTCYVSVHQAPENVFRAFKSGKYPVLPINLWGQVFYGRKVRFGAYGDPAAIPYDVWFNLSVVALGHTGYTHAWKYCDSRFANLVMASCESVRERSLAKASGYRTFRVTDNAKPSKGEFLCPASEDAGFSRTCETCLACSGTRGGKLTAKNGSVVIRVHGSKPKLYAWARRRRVKVRV